MTPTMAAGVTDKLWEMSDLVAIVEAADKPIGKRGPYKKGASFNFIKFGTRQIFVD
jgi:hypothetical protein